MLTIHYLLSGPFVGDDIYVFLVSLSMIPALKE